MKKAISQIHRINPVVTDSCLNSCFHSSLTVTIKFISGVHSFHQYNLSDYEIFLGHLLSHDYSNPGSTDSLIARNYYLYFTRVWHCIV